MKSLPLPELFVRRLMKDGARKSAVGIFAGAMEIIRRKIGDRTPQFVVEASVESRVLPLYLQWLLKHRVTGGRVKTMEDFRARGVAAIVKAAALEPAPTMDRRLAAAILKGYTKSDPGPKGRTPAAARLSAKQAYGSGR